MPEYSHNLSTHKKLSRRAYFDAQDKRASQGTAAATSSLSGFNFDRRSKRWPRSPRTPARHALRTVAGMHSTNDYDDTGSGEVARC